MKILALSLGVVASCLLWTGVSSAQMTQAQTRDFPLSPAPGKTWAGVKIFQNSGDFLFTRTPKPSPTENVYGRLLAYSDYDHYYFGNTHGRNFGLFISYGGDTQVTDSGTCQHTHLNYGVKGFYSINFLGSTFHGWIWVGGGTMSGNWNATTKTCTRSVVNPLAAITTDFGWGTDSVNMPASIPLGAGMTEYFDTFIAVVMAPTHGVGDCPLKFNPLSGLNFKECLDPVTLFAYVL